MAAVIGSKSERVGRGSRENREVLNGTVGERLVQQDLEAASAISSFYERQVLLKAVRKFFGTFQTAGRASHTLAVGEPLARRKG